MLPDREQLTFSKVLAHFMQNADGAEDSIRQHSEFWDRYVNVIWRSIMREDEHLLAMRNRVYIACLLLAADHLTGEDNSRAIRALLAPWNMPPPVADMPPALGRHDS